MRVLVTGGTGFIGSHLVEALLARGDEVVVLGRDAKQRGGLPDAPKLTLREWNAKDRGPWTEEVERCDVVVHLAGASVSEKRWTPERLELIRNSRIDSTRVLAAAIAGAPQKPKVFVSGSAVGLYGMRSDDTVFDEDGPHGTDVLAVLVRDWEAEADPARAAGVRVVHPRIGIVLGARGGALTQLLGPFKAFVGGPVGSGDQWFAWIHWRDTVRALLYAIDTADFAGAFNVVAPNPVRMRDFARALGAALGRPSFFRVPAFAVKLAFGRGLGEVLLTGQRVIPKRLLDAGFSFEFPEVKAALRDAVGETRAA